MAAREDHSGGRRKDLLQKIPELIAKTKRIGERAGVSRERLEKLSVLFDREGYSAELYRYLDGEDQGTGKQRALFISWAKYADKWVNVADHLLPPMANKRRTSVRSQQGVLDNIAVLQGTILLTDQQLDKLPSEIRFDEAHAGEKLLKLNHEKKWFLDCIKILACNLKAEMCRLQLRNYDWRKEVLPA